MDFVKNVLFSFIEVIEVEVIVESGGFVYGGIVPLIKGGFDSLLHSILSFDEVWMQEKEHQYQHHPVIHYLPFQIHWEHLYPFYLYNLSTPVSLLQIESDFNETIPTTHIAIFNIPIHIIKGDGFITLVESLAAYKTISTTRITILQITIHITIITIFIKNQ